MIVDLCAIARTENRYLGEWLDYHLNLGFNHIFLYDNAFGEEEKIRDFISRNLSKYQGKVTVYDVYDKPGMQVPAYTECYLKENFDWIAFIDIDEFITFALGENGQPKFLDIHDYLKEFNNADVIVLNWKCYGDCGFDIDDGRGVLDRFRTPLPLHFSPSNMWGKQSMNWHIKSIYKKALPIQCIMPHTSVGPFKTVNDVGREVEQSPFQKEMSYSVCYVRHFYTKSIIEYLKSKTKRGIRVSGASGNYVGVNFFLFNKPTLSKIKIYRRLCPNEERKSLLWWVKQWVKMWIITPLFVR